MRRSLAAALAAFVVAGTGLAGAGPAGAGDPPGEVAVDETFALSCRPLGGGPSTSGEVRITATVPAELATGETFSVPDLATTASASGQPLIRPEGTDQSMLAPTTVMTVVAPAGGAVVLRLEMFAVIVAGRPVATCFPDGDGVIAGIPVVA